jgi:N-acetylgalactosamine-N,N'-diacetylbacillosaminyl-diphospho-undecaprenol 4-alpha-N-acetylgalactosaminyltransferase
MILPNKKIKIALIGYRLSTGGRKVMAICLRFFENKDWKFTISLFLIPFRMPIQEISQFGKMKNAFNGFLNKWKRLVFLKISRRK